MKVKPKFSEAFCIYFHEFFLKYPNAENDVHEMMRQLDKTYKDRLPKNVLHFKKRG